MGRCPLGEAAEPHRRKHKESAGANDLFLRFLALLWFWLSRIVGVIEIGRSLRNHHERRDGSGYPDGLSGDDIPINARVLQVVDVFDALRTKRPYKKAHSIESSLSIIREEVEKGWWDPEIAGQFIAMIEEESAA